MHCLVEKTIHHFLLRILLKMVLHGISSIYLSLSIRPSILTKGPKPYQEKHSAMFYSWNQALYVMTFFWETPNMNFFITLEQIRSGFIAPYNLFPIIERLSRLQVKRVIRFIFTDIRFSKGSPTMISHFIQCTPYSALARLLSSWFSKIFFIFSAESRWFLTITALRYRLSRSLDFFGRSFREAVFIVPVSRYLAIKLWIVVFP